MGVYKGSINIFFFKQKAAYEIRLSLVGSEMCIRDMIRVGYQDYLLGLFIRVIRIIFLGLVIYEGFLGVVG